MPFCWSDEKLPKWRITLLGSFRRVLSKTASRSDEGEVNNKVLVSPFIFTVSPQRLCSFPHELFLWSSFYRKSKTLFCTARLRMKLSNMSIIMWKLYLPQMVYPVHACAQIYFTHAFTYDTFSHLGWSMIWENLGDLQVSYQKKLTERKAIPLKDAPTSELEGRPNRRSSFPWLGSLSRKRRPMCPSSLRQAFTHTSRKCQRWSTSSAFFVISPFSSRLCLISFDQR